MTMGLIPPAKAPAAVQALYGLCAARFATGVKMLPPPSLGSGQEIQEDGFGDWLPLYTALVTELGLSPGAALDLAVAQGLGMLATKRHNEGYSVAGQNYRVRELPDEPQES